MRHISFLILFIFLIFTGCDDQKYDVTLSTLLQEMVDYDEAAKFPLIPFTCHQESSYDRRSIHPDSIGWFANNDGFGVIKTDTFNGKVIEILFEEKGPGVITRFWLTSTDKNGVLKFYFNNSTQPQWIIPAFDFLKSNLKLGEGLLQAHPNYTSDKKGGNTLFLPIPYSEACKIILEYPDSIRRTPKYYQINFRKYPEGTQIKTFSTKFSLAEKNAIKKTNISLLNPPTKEDEYTVSENKYLASGDYINLDLPKGVHAVNQIEFNVFTDSSNYEQIMRLLILQIEFDKKMTVNVPLSDFSGGGMGAKKSKSWFIESDGTGNIISRWVMPYQNEGALRIINMSDQNVEIYIKADIKNWKWDNRSLYFYSSWRQENKIHVEANPENIDSCVEWNFAQLEGRGVYRGDVLTLFNHTLAWYGEGDEKIWVDNDTFPSHFGTGTEDYYNCSWAPVIPFYTPFGGATRADAETSTGYNTFFRTRNLDQIPFSKKFIFDIEMLSWISGKVDYATTVYWYGDISSKAVNTTPIEHALLPLLEQPEDPAKFQIDKNVIEFEKLTPVSYSKDLGFDVQSMLPYGLNKWSGNSQLLCYNGKKGSYIEFQFTVPSSEVQNINLYLTKAPDYGMLNFTVNGKKSHITFDGYCENVTNSKPITLGAFKSINNKITLKIEIEGKNKNSIGYGGVFGLDCITISSDHQ